MTPDDRDPHSPVNNRPTRRDALHTIGLVAAAAALPADVLGSLEPAVAAPPQAPASRPAVSAVMARLSAYMSEARDRALPDRVLEQTKWHVLDTIAAMV